MITRMVKVQLVIFSILTLVTASAITFIYADLPAKYGWWGQTYVTATFEDGAGIYKAGNVTYRGVGEMGEVTDIDLNPDGGVDVKFRYDSDLDVPANVRAEIHAVSAVGEFYVDLVPPAEPSEEKLKDGDHIPIERTSIPLAIAPVLSDVNTFLESINKDALSNFMQEAADAFEYTGPDLVKLLTNAQRLVDEANTNYEATSLFLRDFGPLFDTQNQIAGSVRNWSSQLASFTAALRAADPAFEGSIDGNIADAAHGANSVVREVNDILPTFSTNLQTLGNVLTTYASGLEAIFLNYPQVIAKEQLMSRTPGLVRLEFAFPAIAFAGPQGCAIGYPQNGDPLTTRNPFDTRDYPSIQDAYCKVPSDDPRMTRGGRNIPCFEPGTEGLRASTVADCRTGGYDDAKVGTSNYLVVPNVFPQGATPVGSGGTFQKADGSYFTMGEPAPAGDWQSLLLPTA